MSQKYEKLKGLLKELFQLDHPDLDFGLYRIMHAKAAEVSQFLDRDLLPQVKEEFAKYKTADKAELEQQLAKAVEQAQALGADPESLPKVKELRAKLADDVVDLAALESEVYDHLYSFFRRYYSEGDFLSKRVYKPGVYAIPYEGEEVKLHWANADQYYIKTSEYLRDYAFRLHPDDQQNPMRVHFRLVDATEGEHGNVKAADGKDRVFILASDDFASIDPGDQGAELSFRFEYRPATLTDWAEDVRDGKKKPPTQKEMTELAESRIMAAGGDLADWISELGKPHEKATGEQADYSRLRAHLNRYVARNSFDYFIHKDLGGFLRRELDSYIKTEVMHLDDIDGQQAPRVEQYLSKVRVIRRIASKLITFLAHLEDFQKKLWLKKKFVVETSYCVTVGSIPETFYVDIAANDAQREEWVKLLAINEIQADLTGTGYSEPLTPAFLKQYPSLMVDTRHFSSDWVARLLDGIESLDGAIDGVLVNAENFQALALMQGHCSQVFDCVYIDPPYNTGGDGFAYKDQYQHSSWLSMLENRLELACRLMPPASVLFVSMDDGEQGRLRQMLDSVFGSHNFIANVIWQKKYSPQNDAQWFSDDHDFLLTYARSKCDWLPVKLPRTAEQDSAYTNRDDDPRGPWKGGDYTCNKSADERPNLFYPIAHPVTGEEVWPSRTRVWAYSREEHLRHVSENRIWWGQGARVPAYKRFLSDMEGRVPQTLWPYSEVGHNQDAFRELASLLPNSGFGSPKPSSLVRRVIQIGCRSNVLDFFAGSGTTGHAAIALNREDGKRRRFTLVEMGRHFDTVLLPRMKKVVFAPEWRDGRAHALATAADTARGPQVLKCIRLESYEDTLNNLQLRRSNAQQTLLESATEAAASRFREQYTLGYMLNVEAEGSQSLLNVRAFCEPTTYTLKVKRPGSDETREVNVDLLETFNWLIGLQVQHIAAPQRFSAKSERDGEGRLQLKGRVKQEDEGVYWFRTVTGTTRDGRKTLVIWRKRPGGLTPEGVEQDNLVLDEWFTRQGYSSKDSEFDLIYVNGTNNLENLRAPDDTWKVRLIEDDFHRLMFATEGL